MRRNGEQPIHPTTPSTNLSGRAPAFDERTAERIPLELPLTYMLMESSGEKRCEGVTKSLNVSGGGVQFIIPSMVSPHTTCHILLTLPDNAEPLSFSGEVRWCRQRPGAAQGTCEVGVAFSSPCSYTDATFIRYSHFIATLLVARYLR